MRPQWQWDLTGPDGAALDRPLSPVFSTRFDAEEWLGAQWRTLRDQGVGGALLRHEGLAVPPAYPFDAPDRPAAQTTAP